MAKVQADSDDLASKTPVELRAIARDLGVENADRMTKAQTLEAIRTANQAPKQH